MEPITREEMYLAAAAGEYSGELPAPITRQEQYLKKIIEEIDGGGSVSPEQIDAAIEAYLNSHDADIVTEQELSDALAGYYDKDAVDTTLNEKQDTLTAGDNISIETINGELTISATDTTYSDATQQTHGLMSTADKTKLDGITAAKMQAWDAAEQNVNADWNAESGDAQILNKPDLTVYALADDVTAALGGKVDKETGRSLMTADEHTKLNGIETGAQVNTVTGVKGNAENDYRTGEINISPANIGLGNVDNTSDANKPISTATQTALDGKVDKENGKALTDINYSSTEKAKVDGAIQSTEKGSSGGVAELDANGKVPSSQLPSFVDDVMEYADVAHFPQAGESGKIYIAVDTNLSYRWTGTGYAEISPSLALGETSSTAYRGDWGKATKDAVGNIQTLQTDDKSNLVAAINELKSTSVSADPNKGLSENDFTDSLKSKLDGIESGAEVNVQPDWNQTVTTADDFIKNKPENLVQDASYVHTDNNYTTGEKTKLAGISAGAQVNTVTGVKGNAENDYRTGDINISPANIGLGNVNNTSDANKPISTATQAALNAKQDALTAGANITIETVNDVLTISATGTTYSAGSGISISNGEISNSAPNVKSDWNAASGSAAEILNKPTIPNYSNATTSAAGLMSATDKSALNAINAGTQVSLMSGGIDLVSASNNRLTLSSAVSNFRAIEIRYAMYTGASSYTGIVRAVNKDGQGDYGNIAALVVRADTAGSLSLYMCNLQLSGSNLTLSAVNNIPSFYVYNVWGYK